MTIEVPDAGSATFSSLFGIAFGYWVYRYRLLTRAARNLGCTTWAAKRRSR
jgi:hypothetical protein